MVVVIVLAWLKGRTPVPQVRVATIEGFLALSPSGFEHEIAALFSTLGYTGMTVSGGTLQVGNALLGGAIIGPPTLVNAIHDALAPFGVTCLDLPLTPKRLLPLLAERGS